MVNQLDRLSITGSMIRRWWLAPHTALTHFSRHARCFHQSTYQPIYRSITPTQSQSRSFASYNRNRSKPSKKPSSKTSAERLAQIRKREQEKSLFNPDNHSVGIFGRPNVGKSTLFNRLAGTRLAIVDSMPGVTRDRLAAPGRLADLEFKLIDTAGMETEHEFLDTKPSAAQLVNSYVPSLALQKSILAQTQAAMSECDVALFVFDARQDLTSEDFRFARLLKKNHVRHVFDSASGKMRKVSLPIVLVANKVETDLMDETELLNYPGLMEAQQLGFGEPVLLSAEHGAGLAALHIEFSQAFNNVKQIKSTYESTNQSTSIETIKERTRIHFAIVGRPNVGKSTLINALVGQNRVLTGEQAGITRDSISIEWTNPSHPDYIFNLIDTAGIRGGQVTRTQAYSAVDVTAMANSFKAISMSHVIALVIDVNPSLRSSSFKPGKRYTENDKQTLLLTRVSSMISAQDWLIAKRVCDEGRALIVVLNKMDLLNADERDEVLEGVRLMCDTHLPQVKQVPIIDLSAREVINQTIEKPNNQSNKQATKKANAIDLLTSSVISAHSRWSNRFNTHRLNEWLHALQTFRPHPSYKGRSVKAKYIVQTSVRPPSFSVLFSGVRADKSGVLEGCSADWLKMMRARLVDEFQLHGLNVRVQARRAGKSREEREDNLANKRLDGDTQKEGVDWNVQDQVMDDDFAYDEEDYDDYDGSDNDNDVHEANIRNSHEATVQSSTKQSMQQTSEESANKSAQAFDDHDNDIADIEEDEWGNPDEYDEDADYDHDEDLDENFDEDLDENFDEDLDENFDEVASDNVSADQPIESYNKQPTRRSTASSDSLGFLTPAPDLALRPRSSPQSNDLALFPLTSKSSFLPPETEEKTDSLTWDKRRDKIQKHQKERTEHIKEKKGLAQFRSPAAYYKSMKQNGERKEKWNRKQRKINQGRINKAKENKRKRTGSAE